MSYIWVVVHIVVGFAFAPIVIRFAGKNEYGLYQVVASFLAYINVLETSLSAGVLRYYCNSLAKKDVDDIENTLAICKIIYRKLTYAVLIIGFGLVIGFHAFYKSSLTESELLEGSVMMVLLVISLCITMTNALYLACMRGNERFTIEKTISSISQIVQLLVCYLALRHFHYAVAATVVQVLMNIIVSIIRYKYSKNVLHVRIKLHERKPQLEKSILIFAAGILLSSVADQIFWKTDQIILAKMFNTTVVAIYAIGSQIYTNYMYAGVTIASVFFPRVSLYYQEDQDVIRISDLFIKVGRIAFFLCLMVFGGFCILGKEFLFLWVGQDFMLAYTIAIIVMIPYTIDIIQNLGLTILQVMNKYSFRAKMYFFAAVLNILLTIILAYNYGMLGAAISTSAAMLITSGIIMNIYYARTIRLNISGFWKNIFLILIKMSPLLIIVGVVNYLLKIQWGVLPFVIKLIIYSIVYIIYAYIYAMNNYERELVKKIVRMGMTK